MENRHGGESAGGQGPSVSVVLVAVIQFFFGIRCDPDTLGIKLMGSGRLLSAIPCQSPKVRTRVLGFLCSCSGRLRALRACNIGWTLPLAGMGEAANYFPFRCSCFNLCAAAHGTATFSLST
jgi:hypothetical protein